MSEWTGQSTSLTQVRQSLIMAELLKMVEGKSVFEQLAMKKSIGANTSGFPEAYHQGGSGQNLRNSVEFDALNPLDIFDESDNLAQIQPGTGPPDEILASEIDSITTRVVGTDIELYAKYMKVGWLANRVSITPKTRLGIKAFADMLWRSRDWLMQRLLLNNFLQNALGTPLFGGDYYRDIQFIGTNGKTTVDAAGGSTAGTTNVVAAPEGAVYGSSTADSGLDAPDWWDLDTLLVVKALLDAERAPYFSGDSYVFVCTPAIEHALIQSEDFIQAAKYSDAREKYRGEVGFFAGMRILKTTEPAWVVGSTSEASATRGTGTWVNGDFLLPRNLISGSYFQAESGSGVDDQTGPLLPGYAMGADSFGMLELDGSSMNIITTDKPDKADPAHLYDTIAFRMAFARVVTTAQWIKGVLGAVDSRTLSLFTNN